MTDLELRDLLLDALTVSSGAVDAISFVALGRVFTAFMTGNIAFLGIRIARADGPDVLAVVVSMAAFGAGVYLSTRIVTSSEVSGTWPRRVTSALGVSLIAHAAFLAVWFAHGGHPSVGTTTVLLGLWAVAMGMQSVAVQSLHVAGVFSTAATGAVILLVGDLAKWSATAPERRRLAGVLVSLFIGAAAGGLLLAHSPRYAPLLPFTITGVVVATAALALREDVASETRNPIRT